MAVPWTQPRLYLFLQHAREHTGLEMKNRFLDRRWRGYHEEPVSVPMAEVMEGTLSRIQEQLHEHHRERAVTMSTSTHKQYPKSTT